MHMGWQAKHNRSTVVAGATAFAAQSPLVLVMGRARDTVEGAIADADNMDALFFGCPDHQRGAAAQAMASIGTLGNGVNDCQT